MTASLQNVLKSVLGVSKPVSSRCRLSQFRHAILPVHIIRLVRSLVWCFLSLFIEAPLFLPVLLFLTPITAKRRDVGCVCPEQFTAAFRKEIEASKISINERLDTQQLRRNFDNLKAIYSEIPEDIRREAAKSLNTQQQRQPRERGEIDRIDR